MVCPAVVCPGGMSFKTDGNGCKTCECGTSSFVESGSSQCSTTGVTKAVVWFPLSLYEWFEECNTFSTVVSGCLQEREREREMFYLTTHSTHFIYGYMASDIWLRTILIVRKETRCRHIGYSYRLTAMVLLYAPSHRQDNTYHGLSYTSRVALAGTRNSSMGPPHEGSIRRPVAQ